MKNLFLTLTTGLILLTACSKDESYEQIDEQTSDIIYVLEQNTEQAAFSTIEIDNPQSSANYGSNTNNPDFAHTSGLFMPTYRDPVILSWIGNRDDTGTYGTAELQVTRPGYSFHFIMETECINVDGNTAVYGALITEVVERSGNTPPIGEMWRFYFQVKDNKIDLSNSFDEISNRWIFASPMSYSLCSVYPPDHHIWSASGYEAVVDPGFVEVSNNPQ